MHICFAPLVASQFCRVAVRSRRPFHSVARPARHLGAPVSAWTALAVQWQPSDSSMMPSLTLHLSLHVLVRCPPPHSSPPWTIAGRRREGRGSLLRGRWHAAAQYQLPLWEVLPLSLRLLPGELPGARAPPAADRFVRLLKVGVGRECDGHRIAGQSWHSTRTRHQLEAAVSVLPVPPLVCRPALGWDRA